MITVEALGTDKAPQEFAGVNIRPEPLRGQAYGPPRDPDCFHGTGVAAHAVGRNLGTAPGAELVSVETGLGGKGQKIYERLLETLLLVLDDIIERGEQGQDLKGRAVVNLSLVVRGTFVNAKFITTFEAILQKLTDDYGTAIVAGSGNERHYGAVSNGLMPPFLLSYTSPSMMVVGATDGNGRRGFISQGYRDDPALEMILHAPGSEYRHSFLCPFGSKPSSIPRPTVTDIRRKHWSLADASCSVRAGT